MSCRVLPTPPAYSLNNRVCPLKLTASPYHSQAYDVRRVMSELWKSARVRVKITVKSNPTDLVKAFYLSVVIRPQ